MNNLQLFKKAPYLLMKLIFSLSLINLSLFPLIAKPQKSTSSEQTLQNKPSLKTNQILFFYNSAINQPPQLWKAFEKEPRYQLIDIATFNSFQIQNFLVDQFISQTASNENNEHCVITLGLTATQKILALKRPLKLFTLDIPRNQLDKLHHSYRDLNINVSGIYQEQSFSRQILLAKSLQPKTKSVTVFLSQDDRFYLPEMLKTADSLGQKLNYKILLNNESEIDFLNQIKDSSQFILLQNNRFQSSPYLLANLVIEASHLGLKLIGNKINSSKLGALASITPFALGLFEQTNDEIDAYCDNNTLALPHYASRFNIMLNHQLAENLVITSQTDLDLLLDSEALSNNIIAIEKSHIKENYYE